ncbi:MAG: YkgJ family cysteine cluster protein [Desulfobulbaceae bacterium]|nr:YkgJ family cysteine cluster protein [Desulfobulbaceae bacterium]HIJ90257.1 YkgJ family cysteine cluster protein [Deltaproteobacteria bacterium]
MIGKKSPQFASGAALLANPILPLARIIQMLYITGPFERIAPILEELTEPVEIATSTYQNPKEQLLPYLDDLRIFEQLKHSGQEETLVLEETLEPLDQFESLELEVSQRILIRELEKINSLLCGPCDCTLCCLGPSTDMNQVFFEIPLQDNETDLFNIPRIDTKESRQSDPHAEPPLMVEGAPFFQRQAALYHWDKNWSLILPKAGACPNLEQSTGGCAIYQDRPDTCRRPQIFPYALERRPEHDADGRSAYIAQRKLLAVWDCPYVQELREEIDAYAQLCGLTPIFKLNKD